PTRAPAGRTRLPPRTSPVEPSSGATVRARGPRGGPPPWSGAWRKAHRGAAGDAAGRPRRGSAGPYDDPSRPRRAAPARPRRPTRASRRPASPISRRSSPASPSPPRPATRRRPSVPRSSPPTNRPSARAGPPTSTPCAPPGAPPEPAGGHRWPGRSPARSRRDDWPRPPRRPGPPRAGGARRPADGPRRRRRLGDGRPPGGGEALATGSDADADTRATTAAGHHDDGTDDAPHAVAATRTLTRASARDGRAPGRLPQRGA